MLEVNTIQMSGQLSRLHLL